MEKSPAVSKKRSRSSSVSSHPASHNGEKKTKISKATSKGDVVNDKKSKVIKNKVVKKSKEKSGRAAKGKAIKIEKYQLRKGKIFLLILILVSTSVIIIFNIF